MARMSLSPMMIDTAAVSELTGIPVRTLKYYRSDGRGPRWARVGKHIVYRPEDVKAWVDEQFERMGPATGTDG